MIAQELVDNALYLIGAASEYEEPSGADRNRAFVIMKSLLNLWRIKRLTIDADVVSTFTLTANTASFTIGSGGDWSIARPTFIRQANFVDASNNETPLAILDDDQYARLPNKAQTATQPSAIWYQRVQQSSLLGMICPWPIQTENGTIALYIPTPLAELSALSTTVYLPDGWQMAIESNLALILCIPFKRPVTQELRELARVSLADIKSINAKAPLISTAPYRDPNGCGGGSVLDFTTRNY